MQQTSLSPALSRLCCRRGCAPTQSRRFFCVATESYTVRHRPCRRRFYMTPGMSPTATPAPTPPSPNLHQVRRSDVLQCWRPFRFIPTFRIAGNAVRDLRSAILQYKRFRRNGGWTPKERAQALLEATMARRAHQHRMRLNRRLLKIFDALIERHEAARRNARRNVG